METFFGLKTGSSKPNKIHLLTWTLWNVESPGSEESISDPKLHSLQHRAVHRWPPGSTALQGQQLLPPRLPPPSLFFFLIFFCGTELRTKLIFTIPKLISATRPTSGNIAPTVSMRISKMVQAHDPWVTATLPKRRRQMWSESPEQTVLWCAGLCSTCPALALEWAS